MIQHTALTHNNVWSHKELKLPELFTTLSPGNKQNHDNHFYSHIIAAYISIPIEGIVVPIPIK